MEDFILCRRKSEKKESKRSDNKWFAWYRDPETGAKLPQNRINIDTLHSRLYGGIKRHVTSKSEAYRIAQEALEHGVVFNYVKVEKPRLIAYIEEFWDYDRSPYVKRVLAEGGSITKCYCKKMGQAFANHCKPHIHKDLPIDGFTVAVMDRIKGSLFDRGLSTSTTHKALESVKIPLREAYKMELITDNIGERLRAVKVRNEEKGILTNEESEKLIRHLKETTVKDSYDRWRYLAVACCYYTGMRNSEIIALTPSCIQVIDENQSRIKVVRGWNEIDGFKPPKNGKPRVVTIPTGFANELLDWSDETDPDGLLFYSLTNKEKPVDEKLMSQAFRDALEAIGITRKEQTERKISFYSLRHGFNSSMVASGLSETEIRTVTGHSSAAMTEHYNHANERALQRQSKAREEAIPYIE